MNALPGLDLWLRAPYDDVEDLPEPTLEQLAEALDRCVADDELLTEYITEACYDPVTLLQLVYAGLPRESDKSPRADAIRDQYVEARDKFFVGYRDWLGDHLDDAVRGVVQEQIESDRRDA